MKPVLKPPGTMLLKLRYDGPLSNVAFNFSLRRYILGLKKEDKLREEKLRSILQKMMFGNVSRVWGGWRLIIARNKRFFRKQQALKRALAQGDEVGRCTLTL